MKTAPRNVLPANVLGIRSGKKPRSNAVHPTMRNVITAPAVQSTALSPPELSGVALEEWHRMAPLLAGIGGLSEVDRSALSAYCVCYAHWREAELALANEGLMFEVTKEGGRTRSVFLQASEKSMREMRNWLIELGCTPSARTRVARVQQMANKKNKWAAFDKKEETR